MAAARQGWSLRLGAVGETQVRLHLTMVLLVAWYAWLGWKEEGTSGAVDQIAFIVLLFASILLHEFGHIFAARHYGIGTPDVLLTPIGGLARIARMPDKPSQELAIALAGPLVTLGIIALLVVVFVIGGHRSIAAPGGFLDLPLWSALLYTNVVLLLFNMIPAFPMDGGRVLRALLASRLGMVRGTRIAARVGQAFAVVLLVLGLTYSPMLMLIAAFVFLGAQAEYEAVQNRHVAGDLTAERLIVTDVRVLPDHTTLDAAIRLLTRSDQRAFPVTDGNDRLVGLLTRDDLLRGVADAGLAGSVMAAVGASLDAGAIPLGTSFEDAMQTLMSSRRDALPVVDADGRFVGLITRDNVTDVLLVERLRQSRGMA